MAAPHALVIPIRMEIDLSCQFQNAQPITAGDELCHGSVDRFLLGFELAELNGLLNQTVIQFQVGWHDDLF